MADHSLKGKVLVVGAGAKNLGGLISRTFGAEGALVTVHYNSDSTKAAADETVKAVNKGGGDAFGVQGDLTKVSEVRRLFDEAVKRYGRVDIAVNTVGKVLKKPFIETTEEEYDSMFDINAKAAYFFIQEAGKRMNDGGKIITILTSLLAASRASIPPMRAARRRWSTSHERPRRSSARAGSRSTMSRRGRWTRRFSIPPRRRIRSPTTSRRA